MINTNKKLIEYYTSAKIWGDMKLDEVFLSNLKSHPDKIALSDPVNKSDIFTSKSHSITYKDANDIINRLVNTFNVLELKEDDIIAFQLPNIVEFYLLILACSRANIVYYPIPLSWDIHRIKENLKKISPKMVITVDRVFDINCTDNFINLAQSLTSIRFIASFGESAKDGVMPLDYIFSDNQDVMSKELAKKNISRDEDDNRANHVITISTDTSLSGDDIFISRSHNQFISLGIGHSILAQLSYDSKILSTYAPDTIAGLGSSFIPWLISGSSLYLHHAFDAAGLLEQINIKKITYLTIPQSISYELGLDSLKDAASSLEAINIIWPENCDDFALFEEQQKLNSDIKIIDSSRLSELVIWPEIRDLSFKEPQSLPLGKSALPANSINAITYIETKIPGHANPSNLLSQYTSGDLYIKSPMLYDKFDEVLTMPKRNHEFTAQKYNNINFEISNSNNKANEEDEFLIDNQHFYKTGYRCVIIDSKDENYKIKPISYPKHILIIGNSKLKAKSLDKLYSKYEKFADAAVFTKKAPLIGNKLYAAYVAKDKKEVTTEKFLEFLKSEKLLAHEMPEELYMVDEIPRDNDNEISRQLLMDMLGGKQ